MKATKGVLLVNLGTPRSPSIKHVYSYLTEFLTDGRVIDLSWIKRQLLVRGIIIPTRVRQSAAQYKAVWGPEGSPLMFHGRSVEKKLQEALGPSYKVVLAMRYQTPSILEGLEALKKENLDEIVVIPLFPQYASATTGSVHEEVMKHLKKWQVIPKMTFLNHYFDHPALLEAFAKKGRQYPLESYDHILFSFHGLPERQIRKIDVSSHCLKEGCCSAICASNKNCYKGQCYATARGIVEKLGIAKDKYTVCFQSRLGKEPWIQPYVTDLIEEWGKKGGKKILVFSPAFVCDCLETLHEIQTEYGKEFVDLGGERLDLVEGLNDDPLWIDTLKQLVCSC